MRRDSYLLAAFIAMMGGRVVGFALLPLLLAQAPLALLALSPTIGHLVMAAPLVSPLAYWAVALPVSLGGCVLGYALGRLHGVAALRLLVARGVFQEPSVQALLAPVRRAAPLVVLAFPGPLVSMLAGVAASRPVVFLPTTTLAQVLWVALCQRGGLALLGWLGARRAELSAFLMRWALPLTLVTLGVVLLVYLHRRRRRSSARMASHAANPNPGRSPP